MPTAPAIIYFGAVASNATGDPTNTSQVYVTGTFGSTNPNPAAFAVQGPIIVAVQGTLTDTPSTLLYANSSGDFEIELQYGGPSGPALPANAFFTCTLFEDSKKLSQGVNQIYNNSVTCNALSNSGYVTTSLGEANLTLPAELDTGHPYTMIVTQGSPSPSST